jgi:UDP-glucuronate decarboxylase
MDKFEKILSDDAIRVNDRINLEEMCGKKVIITGASGLIGINLLMSLKEFSRNNKKNNPSVIAIVHSDIPNYFKGVVDSRNIKVLKGDITDIDFINSLEKADYIIHAAGYGQPGKFLQDKIKTISINTTSTIFLLNKLNDGGKFVFLSSSEVCSGLSNIPFKINQIGTTNTMHPRSCYIEGKRCGETICHTYYEMGDKVKSVRLSLAYGPGTKAGDARVLNSFIEKGLSGKIKMLDRGNAKRTYCYVSDAIEVIWNVLLTGKNPIYNVGGFSSTTIISLAKEIGKKVNATVIIPKDDKDMAGAPGNVQLEMNDVLKEFNMKRKEFVSLDKGLEKTIEWQKEIYK